MNTGNSTGSFYDAPENLKASVFVILILIGIFLEGLIHFADGIAIVYSQFYYLIVVVAGLWYGRLAVVTALFFGGLEIIISLFLVPGAIPFAAILRALMLVIVAVVIWKVVENMKRYQNRVLIQNRELKEVNVQLANSQKAFVMANKKLNLLSGITRHDIRNQLTALLAYIELSRKMEPPAELKRNLENQEIVANNILRQIEFTKTYEDIGVKAPIWNNVAQLMVLNSPALASAGIDLTISTDTLEIYTDPLLEKVFENLVDNSIRHGEHVKHITVTYKRQETGLLLMYCDDGVGVIDTDKEKIFEKGFGKHTGLGLFISREILSITGVSIRETGRYGSGVRFEIEVPDDCYRFGGKLVPAGT